jgi:hypothetical protein
MASLGILFLIPWSDSSLSILIILLFVASLIHFLMMSFLQAMSYKLGNVSWRFWSVVFVMLGILIPLLLGVLLPWNESSWTMAGLASCLVYVSGIVAMILCCVWMVGQYSTTTTQAINGTLCLAALVLITFPGILAGSFTLLLWEQQVDGRSWWLWARLVLPTVVLALCHTGRASPLQMTGSTQSPMVWLRRFLLVGVMVGTTGPHVLRPGNSFRVAHLVTAVLLTECCLSVLARLDSCWNLSSRIPFLKRTTTRMKGNE